MVVLTQEDEDRLAMSAHSCTCHRCDLHAIHRLRQQPVQQHPQRIPIHTPVDHLLRLVSYTPHLYDPETDFSHYYFTVTERLPMKASPVSPCTLVWALLAHQGEEAARTLARLNCYLTAPRWLPEEGRSALKAEIWWANVKILTLQQKFEGKMKVMQTKS